MTNKQHNQLPVNVIDVRADELSTGQIVIMKGGDALAIDRVGQSPEGTIIFWKDKWGGCSPYHLCVPEERIFQVVDFS